MGGQAPAKNIQVRPNDVVTIPKGKLVYVMGAVRKSGGFVLGEREHITVLEALSMAEGADAFAKKSAVKILRKSQIAEKRDEILVDLGRVLAGKAQDQSLEADDILYVPVSGGKKAVARTTEALVQITTGLIIWRR